MTSTMSPPLRAISSAADSAVGMMLWRASAVSSDGSSRCNVAASSRPSSAVARSVANSSSVVANANSSSAVVATVAATCA